MLPNFRRTEPDLKIQSGSSHSTGSSLGDISTFPSRPIIAGSTRPGDRTVSLIGPDLTITGNLISKGEVQVDGTVEGDIHGSHVVIGETATINGTVIADEVVVRGHVAGSIRSKRVMLQSTSQVEGDIYHHSLSIEQGALFEGKSRRTSDDPRTIAVAKPAPVIDFPPQLPDLAS